MEATAGFNSSNRFKNHLGKCSNFSWKLALQEQNKCGECFAVRLWSCFGWYSKNQQSYGQVDVTVGFSKSERPGIALEKILIIVMVSYGGRNGSEAGAENLECAAILSRSVLG